MSKNDRAATRTAGAAQRRRDRAMRLRRRITSTVAATGAATVGAFGLLAADHTAGSAALASAAATSPSTSPTASASSSSSSSGTATTPTIAPATTAPTATAAPTAQAVTGGSGH